MIFKGKKLEQVAHHTDKLWDGKFNVNTFKKLLTEMGIIGRIRKDGKKDGSGYYHADFEYFMGKKLPIRPHDLCAIHPMFYHYLNINIKQRVPSRTGQNRPILLIPFPNSEAYTKVTTGYSSSCYV
jgi:hypothetical protein